MMPQVLLYQHLFMALRATISPHVARVVSSSKYSRKKQQSCKANCAEVWQLVGSAWGSLRLQHVAPQVAVLPACRWGHTPLQHAVSRRHGPAIEVLQKYDARLGSVPILLTAVPLSAFGKAASGSQHAS